MRQLIGTNLKRFLRDFKRENPSSFDIVAVCQSVEYPYNVGSIFRLADGGGLTELILTGVTPTPPNPTIAKVGRGKTNLVPWRYVENSEDALLELKKSDYRIVAIELTDSSIPYYTYNYPKKTCLVVGHEDHGITKSTLSKCDDSVFIPMYGKGRSLNVHTALAIVLFHILHNQK